MNKVALLPFLEHNPLINELENEMCEDQQHYTNAYDPLIIYTAVHSPSSLFTT